MDNKNSNKSDSKSSFRRGFVELMILYLLSQNDYYGWEWHSL